MPKINNCFEKINKPKAMMLQLNPTIDVLTPKGKAEAIVIIDYGVNVNSVWLCRMQGGKVLHFYSDDVRIYGNPMNGNGWDVVADYKKTEDEDLTALSQVNLLAPNGKPSNLTPKQYRMVRTPEFKAWFGDWENDPENASKVVDENKEPLVVWHGTLGKFNIFDFNRADIGFHFGTYEHAKNRSETKFAPKGYKQIIEPYFLNIRNLFVINDALQFEYPQSYIDDLHERKILTEQEINKNGLKGLTTKEANQLIRNLLVEKYENVGFKYENKLEGDGISYIVCDTNQIKLADGSNTNFDGSNLDKICTKCGLEKPIALWITPNSGKKTERYCKDCYVNPNPSTLSKPF